MGADFLVGTISDRAGSEKVDLSEINGGKTSLLSQKNIGGYDLVNKAALSLLFTSAAAR